MTAPDQCAADDDGVWPKLTISYDADVVSLWIHDAPDNAARIDLSRDAAMDLVLKLATAGASQNTDEPPWPKLFATSDPGAVWLWVFTARDKGFQIRVPALQVGSLVSSLALGVNESDAADRIFQGDVAKWASRALDPTEAPELRELPREHDGGL